MSEQIVNIQHISIFSPGIRNISFIWNVKSFSKISNESDIIYFEVFEINV